jgi:hypothetical protein
VSEDKEEAVGSEAGVWGVADYGGVGLGGGGVCVSS